MSRRLSRLIVLAWIAAALSACGYSLSGRGSFLPTYIKRIGVPTFVNRTAIPDLDRQLTERVRTELISRGRWTIVPEETGVDALLKGEIGALTLTPAALNAQNQATRYALTVFVNVEFRDLKANKVIFANPSMQFREEYDTSVAGNTGDAGAFLQQDANALERLANVFARNLVSAMLEAF
jgi:hypothetical protein